MESNKIQGYLSHIHVIKSFRFDFNHLYKQQTRSLTMQYNFGGHFMLLQEPNYMQFLYNNNNNNFIMQKVQRIKIYVMDN